jgi:hypothetical protein
MNPTNAIALLPKVFSQSVVAIWFHPKFGNAVRVDSGHRKISKFSSHLGENRP